MVARARAREPTCPNSSNVGPPAPVPRCAPGSASLAIVTATLSQLAHQGGWDEVSMVLLPIALFAVLLAIANRRATREQAEQDEAPDDAVPPQS